MWRFLLLLVLFTPVLSIDHELFKNCSRVSFCARMRHQILDKSTSYSADITNYSMNDDQVVTLPLNNSNGDQLLLQISIYTGSTARIKVLEPNHSRYELKDVLDDGFLPVSSIYVSTADKTLRFYAQYDRNIYIEVKGAAPFSLQFFVYSQVRLVLKGDRLVMNRNDESQAFSFDVEFRSTQKMYGLHHHTTKLALRQTADDSSDPFHLKNLDSAHYEVDSTMALYGAVPVIYGYSSVWTSGIFLHNAAEQWVDTSYDKSNANAYLMVESGTFDLFVILGGSTMAAVREFTLLTGISHLPQLWALGYHQSRNTYLNQEDVKDVVANMDKHNFPMDAIWLDIDYTDEKKYFTWDPERFSDPVEMQTNLSFTNRKLITTIDPHCKVDENYPVYTGGKDKFFLKWSNGSNFEDQSWPGLSSWFDFLNPDARNYFATLFSYEKFIGSTEVLAGICNGMNEPSIFDTKYENTMPSEILHVSNVLHRDVHNLYGFLQTMATHQGLIQRDASRKRPFILTRSHFAGSQRYAAMSTGDNYADWPYLSVSYSECINSNLMGMVFCGADVGGFYGNPDKELLQRWYQAGMWLPLFRAHSSPDTERREPYLFSEEVQAVIRQAIKLRYKHLPVWYTLFYEHTRFGDPIIRPFFYDHGFPEQDDHVLVGRDILARPVLEANASSVTVVFPGHNANWYRVDDESWSIHKGDTTENVNVNIYTSPFYYRAGSIITRKEREKRSTTEMRDDPLTLYISLDENNNAEGTYYQDDYESFKYSTEQIYLYISFTYIPETMGVHITTIDGNAKNISPVIQEVIVHSAFHDENTSSKIRYTTNSDGIPLQNIDIIGQFRSTNRKEMTILL